MICFASCNAQNSYTSLNNADFAKTISNKNVQLVDVRTADEYSAGHLANAINIDVKETDFTQKVDSLLNKEQPVAVYCRSGRRSKQAAEILVNKGFTVFEMNTGYINYNANE
ncbi:MAG: rhodanese-like domain-containing protein [Salinivirgaceae bacterium]|nr:rhodanese-like domain-containing protein [Salinivirgaceae bacterium]